MRKNTSLVAQFWTPSRWGVKLAKLYALGLHLIWIYLLRYINLFIVSDKEDGQGQNDRKAWIDQILEINGAEDVVVIGDVFWEKLIY